MVIVHMELGIGEFFLFITQGAHASPITPLLERIMNIGDTLCHRA